MSGQKGKSELWGFAIDVSIVLIRSREKLLLVFLATMLTPVAANAQSEPAWVSATALTSTDGHASLQWSLGGDEAIALFRLSEEHAGTRQVSFTDQAEMQVFRGEPGIYTFLIQACTRSEDGYPQCGEVSPPLVLTVANTAQDRDFPDGRARQCELFHSTSDCSRN